MAKPVKRFYELSPAWPFGEKPPIRVDGWEISLSASVSFAFLQSWFPDRVVPSSAKLVTKPRQRMSEVIVTGGKAPIVSAKFKAVVETVDPGAAEFRPFALRWKDDTPVPGEWHLCNLLRRIDCIDFEFMGKKAPQREDVERGMIGKRTDPMTEEEYWYREGIQNHPFVRIHVKPDAIGDAQIWRPRWYPSCIFITDVMRKSLEKAHVAAFHFEKLGTRDEPLPEL